MAMTYTSLVAPKGTTGSIANWAGYSKLDIPAVLDEAQMLLYETLRVREMRTEWTFGIVSGQSFVDYPARYMDPAGPVFDITNGRPIYQFDSSVVLGQRAYEDVTGTIPMANPFYLTSGSTTVLVIHTDHGLTQESTITYDHSITVGGVNFEGTFGISSIISSNAYNLLLNTPATASVSGGGGTGITFIANRLIDGVPSSWAHHNNGILFDVAASDPCTYRHFYYRRPELLSATNLTNFLTDRYPKLLRVATQAAAADFMEDDTKYQKHLQMLGTLALTTGATDDFSYRGATFGTDTPYGR